MVLAGIEELNVATGMVAAGIRMLDLVMSFIAEPETPIGNGSSNEMYCCRHGARSIFLWGHGVLVDTGNGAAE